MSKALDSEVAKTLIDPLSTEQGHDDRADFLASTHLKEQDEEQTIREDTLEEVRSIKLYVFLMLCTLIFVTLVYTALVVVYFLNGGANQ